MPLNPVVRSEDVRDSGPMNWPPLGRLAGTMEKRSHPSARGSSPSPFPVWPWHYQHLAICHTSAASDDRFEAAAAAQCTRARRAAPREERLGLRRIGAVPAQHILDYG